MRSQAAVDRGEEVALFLLDDLRHALGRFGQLGIGPLHLFDDHVHQPVQEGLVNAQLPAVQHRPAQQPLDDVFFLVRAGIDVLVDGQRAGPHVVGNPPQPPPLFAGRIVFHPADLGRGQHDRPQDVDVVIRVDSLQHRGGPLQPHAGVDVLAGQRTQIVRRIADAVELGEDQIPDFDFAAAVGREIDFAARSADAVGAAAGGAGGPEIVVLAHPLDFAGGQLDFAWTRCRPLRRRRDRPSPTAGRDRCPATAWR